MPILLVAFLVVLALLAALNAATRVSPALAAKIVRTSGGAATLAAAAFVMLRGRIDLALGLGGLGLWLLGLGKKPNWGPFARWGGAPSSGSTSKVASPSLEMELDHDTGAMRGMVLTGAFAGRSLDDLSEIECQTFYAVCLRGDEQAARLLEAYLDRRFAGWRAAENPDTDTSRRARPGNSAMTKEQACEILGLEKGASRDAITQAHRRLMKKMHPDHGGTTELAARLNEARDVLIRRHD